VKHMLDRTNPMGERPFVGRCRYCGIEGLPIEGALLDCPAAPDSGEALLDALDGDQLDENAEATDG
jgi:hypothetical protein